MIENDFSQLPVIENDKPIGFVTSDSIGRTLLNFGAKLSELHVKDALTRAKVFSADDDIFSILDDLLTTYAVLITNEQGNLRGIVTNYDTTQYFRSRAEDIMLLEDIETNLKDHIRSVHNMSEEDEPDSLKDIIEKISSRNGALQRCYKVINEANASKSWSLNREDVKALVDQIFPSNKSSDPVPFNRLTLNEYILLARTKETWKKLHPIFGISDDSFRILLEDVRDTRNKLAHFRGDLSAMERDRLRFCADWFKNHPIPKPTKDDNEKDASDSIYEPTTMLAQTNSHDTGDEVVDIDEGKYAPLAYYLQSQSAHVSTVTLTFDRIEKELGIALPQTAREHRSWWANDSVGHVQSRQWLGVDWRVTRLDINEGTVTFGRIRQHEETYRLFFEDVKEQLSNEIHAQVRTASSYPGVIASGLILPLKASATLYVRFTREDTLRIRLLVSDNESTGTSSIEVLRNNKSLLQGYLGQELHLENTYIKSSNRGGAKLTRGLRIVVPINASIISTPSVIGSLKQWAVSTSKELLDVVTKILSEEVANPI